MHQKNFTIRLMPHLPKIPLDLIQGFQEWDRRANKFDGVLTGSRTATRDGELIKTATFTKYEIPSDTVRWIRDNIADDYFDIGITYTANGSEHLPHTDIYREYSLNYVLDTGGDQVRTVYYSDGKDQLRKDNGQQPQDLDLLTEVNSLIISEQTWTLLDSRVIHGVQNITGRRAMIGLSFKHWPQHLFS